MEEQVLNPLNSLETSFNALLTSLTTTPSYSGAPSAAQSLLTADHSLTTALQALYVHQQNYARILHLREEASRLEDQIKTTIRTCVDLRRDIGNIHPSILSHHSEDADSDDDIDGDSDRKQQDIDYHTLLSFASKIGRHNAAAAKEAEEESVRRHVRARQEKKTAVGAEPRINGTGTASASAAVAASSSTATAGITNGESTSQSLLPQHERDWLDGEAAMARARAGMAFPVAENLRRGALGRLQWIREQQQQQGGGEEAVDREVERMIAEAEGRRPREESPVKSAESAQHQHPVVETAAHRPGAGLPSRPQQAARPPAPPAPERKKSVVALDLDLWNEDDDDDDD